MKPWLLRMLEWNMYGGFIVLSVTMAMALYCIWSFCKVIWNEIWNW